MSGRPAARPTRPETGVEALRVEGVSKHFDGVYALCEVDIDLRRGEVHALVGENGAGKSTLIKALAGYQRPDSGRVFRQGREVVIGTPADARSLGIAVIFQDFDLPPNLPVVDSLLLGQEETGPLGLLRFRRRRKRAREWLRRAGLDVSLDAATGSLSAAQRQLLALARALSQNARILIMDEPTSALAPHEASLLLDLVEGLRAEGRAVLFVSHKLNEVMQVADRVTVLRDGRIAGARETGRTTVDELVSMMVGRELRELFEHRPRPAHDRVLVVRGLTRRGVFTDVTFDAARGEVLGLYGLKGGGRTALLRALFGLDEVDRGTVEVGNRPRRLHSPAHAVRAGIARVPEDRKAEALFPNMDCQENLTLAALDAVSRWGCLLPREERAATNRYLKRLRVKAASPRQPVDELSGGNQQKVVLARWLLTSPTVLLLDEPTAGIDIGAKAEIYRLVGQLSEQGMAVLFATSEMPELLGVSDRILVMAGGVLVGEFARQEATEARIMRAIQSGEPLPDQLPFGAAPASSGG